MSANSFFKQPGWDHVFAAFVAGAREARANPEADETVFGRAADAYTKLIFSEVDPETHRRIGENDWPDYARDASVASPRTDNTEPARARQESPKGCEAVQTRSHEVASKGVCDGEATDAPFTPVEVTPAPEAKDDALDAPAEPYPNALHAQIARDRAAFDSLPPRLRDNARVDTATLVEPSAPEPSEAITDEMVERAFVVIYGGPSDYIFDSGNKYGRAGRSARESALNKVRAAIDAALAARGEGR